MWHDGAPILGRSRGGLLTELSAAPLMISGGVIAHPLFAQQEECESPRQAPAQDDLRERGSEVLSLSKSPWMGGDVRPLRLVLGLAAG